MQVGEGTLRDVPEVDFDPYAADVRTDPYPLYAEMREVGPVFFLKKYGCYGVARWEEVTTVLKDYARFTSTAGASLADIRNGASLREGSAIVSADPPAHTEMRSVMNRVISPVVVRKWRETFETEGRKLVQALVARGEFDVVRDLAEAFVTEVFPKALGIEITREQAIVIGDFNFNGLGPQNDLFWQSFAQMEPLRDYVARSRTREFIKPGGWAGELFDAEDAGNMPPGTASSLVMTLMRGGMDTTISGIGTTVALLAKHPDQWALLRKDPSRARAAFEEAIRIESPFQSYYRATTKNVELAGYRLNDDVKVQMFIGSANRDPRKFPDPDRYDITRDTTGLTSFGGGAHTCVGQMIARLEAEAVIKPLVELASKISIEGSLMHRPNNSLRTYARLPTKVVAC